MRKLEIIGAVLFLSGIVLCQCKKKQAEQAQNIDQGVKNNCPPTLVFRLVYNASRGSISAVREVLNEIKHKGTINCRNEDGRNALEGAILHKHRKITKLLLENGADCNSLDERGYNAVVFTAAHGTVGDLKLLIKYGANLKKGYHGNSSLLSYAGANKNNDVMTALLDMGLNPNHIDNDGHAPLNSSTGNLEGLKLLLERGADVHHRTDGGWTVLHSNALDDCFKCTELLIKKGVALDQQTRDEGVTALMIAAKENHYKTVQVLISNGANIHLRDKKGKTALDYARKDKQNRESIKLLTSVWNKKKDTKRSKSRGQQLPRQTKKN